MTYVLSIQLFINMRRMNVCVYGCVLLLYFSIVHLKSLMMVKPFWIVPMVGSKPCTVLNAICTICYYFHRMSYIKSRSIWLLLHIKIIDISTVTATAIATTIHSLKEKDTHTHTYSVNLFQTMDTKCSSLFSDYLHDDGSQSFRHRFANYTVYISTNKRIIH